MDSSPRRVFFAASSKTLFGVNILFAVAGFVLASGLCSRRSDGVWPPSCVFCCCDALWPPSCDFRCWGGLIDVPFPLPADDEPHFGVGGLAFASAGDVQLFFVLVMCSSRPQSVEEAALLLLHPFCSSLVLRTDDEPHFGVDLASSDLALAFRFNAMLGSPGPSVTRGVTVNSKSEGQNGLLSSSIALPEP